MNQNKQIEALFVLCKDLQSQIKALSEVKQSCCQHCKVIDEVKEEIQSHVEFNAEEIAKVNSELDLVDKGMDRLFNRTNDLNKKLSATPAQSFSVSRQNPPQFAKSSHNQRSKPDQVRRQVRICYNCKRPGHLAARCHKTNPRLQGLNEPPHKLKLSDQLKNKQPQANSVQPEADQSQGPEHEVSLMFGTTMVAIESNGNYTPFVYPNGSSNHMLKDYTYEELNRKVTPFGT